MPFDLNEKDLARYYQLPKPGAKKTAAFVASYFYNTSRTSEEHDESKQKTSQTYDKVAENLFLGMIPTQTQIENIQKYVSKGGQRLGLVISVTDYFELAGSGLNTFGTRIASPKEWEAAGVRHYQLPLADFTADVSSELLLEAAHLIKETIDKGEAVYIHCKAGRARSAMVVLIFLMLYGDEPHLKAGTDFDTAKKYLTDKRMQVDISKSKEVEILKAVALAERQKREDKKDNVPVEYKSEDLAKNIANYLGSLAIKNEMRLWTSFKELAIYAIQQESILKGLFKKCHRSEHIRDFFNAIYTAKDGQWCVDLLNEKGPIKDLVDANPRFQTEKETLADKTLRSSLVDNFKENVMAHLMEKFHCSKEQALAVLPLMKKSAAAGTTIVSPPATQMPSPVTKSPEKPSSPTLNK